MSEENNLEQRYKKQVKRIDNLLALAKDRSLTQEQRAEAAAAIKDLGTKIDQLEKLYDNENE